MADSDIIIIVVVVLFFVGTAAMASLPFLVAYIIEKIIDWRRGRAGPGGFPVLPPDPQKPTRPGPLD